MIISFSGRQSSGKTTLARTLMAQGFIKISFSDRLKELVSELYGWSIEQLNCPVHKEVLLAQEVVWNSETAARLAGLIGADCLNSAAKVFKTRRQALQYIGTEVLRDHNLNFHIEEFRKRVEPGKNYVVDDLRFPNELALLNDMDAICVFVIRPSNPSASNHLSETSLNRSAFQWVILNTGSERRLLHTFKAFYHWVSTTAPLCRDGMLGPATVHRSLAGGQDQIDRWEIRLSRTTCRHNADAFLYPTPESAYWAGVLSRYGSVKQHKLKLVSIDRGLIARFRIFVQSNKPITTTKRGGKPDSYGLCITCPYIVEDMKLWCIGQRKAGVAQVPDCILDNQELLSCWMVGRTSEEQHAKREI